MTATLRLKAKEAPLPQVPWRIESPTPGVVLVEAVLDTDRAPLHWRVGQWDKPPLDLWMDASGRLLGVQFALQDERVGPEDTTADKPVDDHGRPVFDVSSWPEDRYIDTEAPVVAARAREGTLALRIGDCGQIDRLLQVGDGLAVGLRTSALATVRLGPLSAEDWETIDAFSWIPDQP